MTARKIIVASLAAALVAGTAMTAAAAGRDRHGPPRHGFQPEFTFLHLLREADTDRDARITKEELAAYRDRLFEAVDANKDGFITRGEILDYRDAQREELRKQRRAEAEARKDAAAAEAEDEDQDEGGEAAEVEADSDDRRPDGPGAEGPRAEAPRGEGPREGGPRAEGPRGDDRRADARRDGDRRFDGPRDGRPHGWRHHEGNRHDGRRAKGPGLFRLVDADRDGRISKAEAETAADRLFERSDRNKDGVISIDDLPRRPF